VLALLDLVQLSGYEGRFPAQLSGGQRQRVALARALAVEPRVLLLDEPFGALDAKVRKDLRRWLRDIHRQTGQTTIFVTHDQDEAIELADRVAILNHGRIEQVGTPDEVQDEPSSAFVMSFIGDVVRFPARVENGQVLVAGKPVPVAIGAGPDGDVGLYCRPWDIRLAAADQAVVAGAVRSVRRVGGVRRADVALDPDIGIEIEVPLGVSLRAGESVCLAIGRARMFGPDPVVRPAC
jgi:sulfate transport system ATP-binding protein